MKLLEKIQTHFSPQNEVNHWTDKKKRSKPLEMSLKRSYV